MTSAAKTKNRPSGRLFFLALLSCIILAACSGEPGTTQLTGRTMGTSWNISYLPVPAAPAAEELQKGVAAVLEGIDASMSTYRKNSEISSFNRAKGGVWFPVSANFFEVLKAALEIGKVSGGAYDVTVGPLVNRWGFGPGHKLPDVPGRGEIVTLLARVGQDKLQIDSAVPAVMKPVGLSLDFSSIAKGYAVDEVARYLLTQQIENFLVEVGGEMRLSGMSGRGDNWRVAIEQPDGGARTVARTIALTDAAVATSGDYRNYFELNNKRYSHSIDPRTGHPVEHDLVSVTVIHPSAMMADGWATALTVLGTSQASALALEQGLAVYFIRREGEELLSSYNEAFEPYLAVPGDDQ